MSHFPQVLVLSVALLACTPSNERRAPNIVFVLADDLGWSDTEPYGSTFYRTPAVNRLAEGGVRFTNAYAASPLCSPTRASILTGRTPGRLQLTGPAGHIVKVVLEGSERETAPPDQRAATPRPVNRLDPSYQTLGETLRDAGYATGFLGKWHLGREVPYVPESFGFERVIGGRHHVGPPPPGHYFAPWDAPTLPPREPGTHLADTLGDEAVRFIREHRQDPFFLCLWFYSVHGPFQGVPELTQEYASRVDPGSGQRSPVMGAMVAMMDRNLGRVLDELDAQGLADDTIVVFTSDNGGNRYKVVDGVFPTSNAPLRGGKGNSYEGGIRVPLVVRWPGGAVAKAVSDTVVSSVDFFPTLLELVGLPARNEDHLDGISFAPALRGEAPGDPGRAVFFHVPLFTVGPGNIPNTAVRSGSWKLIRFYFDGPDGQHRYELYDLEADPGESNDLSQRHPERVRELDALIEAEIARAGYDVPRPNQRYRGNLVGQWLGNEDAKISAVGGRLVLESTGDAPAVTTRFMPDLAEPGFLELRMRSDVEGVEGGAGIDWREGSEWRSVDFRVASDGQWRDYRVDLPFSSRPETLRIRPGTGPGHVEIEFLRLWSRERELLRDFSFY